MTAISEKQRFCRRLGGVTLAAFFIAGLGASVAAAQEPPIRAGIDGQFAPHAFPSPGGGLQGFNIDLLSAISAKLGRKIDVESAAFAGLIPALHSGRYGLLGIVLSATPEQAENLLFTEPYLRSSDQFAIKAGSAPIKSLTDLKGKVISVAKGNKYERYLRENAATLGTEVLPLENTPDAIQAVFSGRAYAILAGSTTLAYAAKQNKQLVPDFIVSKDTASYALPLAKGSAALRNRVDWAIECLKRDGTLAGLTEKWFGITPEAGAIERVVIPGSGLPDLAGYDPTPHQASCN